MLKQFLIACSSLCKIWSIREVLIRKTESQWRKYPSKGFCSLSLLFFYFYFFFLPVSCLVKYLNLCIACLPKKKSPFSFINSGVTLVIVPRASEQEGLISCLRVRSRLSTIFDSRAAAKCNRGSWTQALLCMLTCLFKWSFANKVPGMGFRKGRMG